MIIYKDLINSYNHIADNFNLIKDESSKIEKYHYNISYNVLTIMFTNNFEKNGDAIALGYAEPFSLNQKKDYFCFSFWHYNLDGHLLDYLYVPKKDDKISYLLTYIKIPLPVKKENYDEFGNYFIEISLQNDGNSNININNDSNITGLTLDSNSIELNNIINIPLKNYNYLYLSNDFYLFELTVKSDYQSIVTDEISILKVKDKNNNEIIDLKVKHIKNYINFANFYKCCIYFSNYSKEDYQGTIISDKPLKVGNNNLKENMYYVIYDANQVGYSYLHKINKNKLSFLFTTIKNFKSNQKIFWFDNGIWNYANISTKGLKQTFIILDNDLNINLYNNDIIKINLSPDIYKTNKDIYYIATKGFFILKVKNFMEEDKYIVNSKFYNSLYLLKTNYERLNKYKKRYFYIPFKYDVLSSLYYNSDLVEFKIDFTFKEKLFEDKGKFVPAYPIYLENYGYVYNIVAVPKNKTYVGQKIIIIEKDVDFVYYIAKVITEINDSYNLALIVYKGISEIPYKAMKYSS